MENVCSLARFVAALPAIAWDNASQAILERSLDDSANRRLFLPEAFLATDEMLRRTARVIREMVIDEAAIRRNMGRYGPFAASERVLMTLVEAGASRQESHDWIREASLQSWQAIQEDSAESRLAQQLAADERITAHLAPERVLSLMDASAYVGTAPERALAFAELVRHALNEPEPPAAGAEAPR
jgi:adenylosuccinate lyase